MERLPRRADLRSAGAPCVPQETLQISDPRLCFFNAPCLRQVLPLAASRSCISRALTPVGCASARRLALPLLRGLAGPALTRAVPPPSERALPALVH